MTNYWFSSWYLCELGRSAAGLSKLTVAVRGHFRWVVLNVNDMKIRSKEIRERRGKSVHSEKKNKKRKVMWASRLNPIRSKAVFCVAFFTRVKKCYFRLNFCISGFSEIAFNFQKIHGPYHSHLSTVKCACDWMIDDVMMWFRNYFDKLTSSASFNKNIFSSLSNINFHRLLLT